MATSDTDTKLSNRQRKIRERQRATVDTRQFPNQTAFRQAERRFRYGGEFSPDKPDTWTGVIDFSRINALDESIRHEIIELKSQWDPRTARLSTWTDGNPAYNITASNDGWSGEQVFTAPKIYTLASAPGLIVMPELLTPAAQRYITRRCLSAYARPPNRNNLDAHYILPDCGVWQLALREINSDTCMGDTSDGTTVATSQEPAGYYDNENDSNNEEDTPTSSMNEEHQHSTELPSSSTLLRKLRWTTLGYQYNWSKKQYHPDHRYAFPSDLAELTRIMVRAINGVRPMDPTLAEGRHVPLFNYDYEQYQPEAGVVNFYQLRNTLTAHVDKSEENMEAPLVSFSIGHACIYLLGGEDRSRPPIPIYLRSGDVLIMTGASRYAYHGVPRIVENSLPQWLHVNSCDNQETVANSHGIATDSLEQSKLEIDQHCWLPYGRYLSTSRINVNVRQVMLD
ncbi:hypothetical protein BDF22DRAFT_690214 [Syncephalis plumigaleata]|nr:hypothetical protein BDF22DRAFT_690214 [Syncephalis plumigaleata]